MISKMYKNGLLALALTTFSAWTADAKTFDADYSKSSGEIYILIPGVTTSPRFEKRDAPNIEASIKEYAPNVTVKVFNANDSVSEQASQMEAALARGPLAIILMAVDPSQTGGMLARAHNDGIPVVTYANNSGGGPAAYHVTVPFDDIGFQQGTFMKEHLPEARPVKLGLILGDPSFPFYGEQMKGFDKAVSELITNGTIKVVCRSDAMLFSPTNAQRNTEQCLTQTNNAVDAVYVMHDGTAKGAFAALVQQNLQGKTKIFGGYDADLDAIQRVLLGWQEADMSPPYKAQAEKAAVLALAAAAKTEPPSGIINGEFDNGFMKVPASNTANIFITKDNIQETVVDAGIWTKAEICTGDAAETDFCKK
jgi:D-xylose transport system substrate-binding protein